MCELTLAPHGDCRSRTGLWKRQLLFGKLLRETQTQVTFCCERREREKETGGGKVYLHLHLGTGRQAVPAALMDASTTVWKGKGLVTIRAAWEG